MNKTSLAAIGLLLSTPALADGPKPVGIYDTFNRFVGTYAGISPLEHQSGIKYNLLTHEFNGIWYTVEYGLGGFGVEGIFYYSTPNCSGTPYLDPNNFNPPILAAYDGIVLYAPNINGIAGVNVQSTKYFETCTPTNFSKVLYAAQVLDSDVGNHFTPSFHVK